MSLVFGGFGRTSVTSIRKLIDDKMLSEVAAKTRLD